MNRFPRTARVATAGALLGILVAWLGMALNNPLSVRLTLKAPGLSTATLPGMVRDLVTVEVASIADRGGLILYGRSVLNYTSDEEVAGMFYLHGPQFYHRLVAGTSLGPAPGDFKRDGRWQRLNQYASDFANDDMQAQRDGRPEDAISFHRQVSAEYVRRTRALLSLIGCAICVAPAER